MSRLSVITLPFLIAALATTGITQAVAQQTSGPMSTQEGDTIMIVVHRVPEANKAAYERWMTQVWWPAAQKAGRAFPGYGKSLSARRRFVPAQPAEKGMLTYMFVYPNLPGGTLPQSKNGGMGAALEASGMPAAQINSELGKFKALGATVDVYMLAQHEYK